MAELAAAAAEVAAQVAAARALQVARYATLAPGAGVRTNAEADGELLMKVAEPNGQGTAPLREATGRLRLTARGYHRVLKVARTPADLDGGEAVRRIHVAEALSYRRIALGH